MPTHDGLPHEQPDWLYFRNTIELRYACPHCGDAHPFSVSEGDLLDVTMQFPVCPRTQREVKAVVLPREPIQYCHS